MIGYLSCVSLSYLERNFKEAKRLKEERETSTQEGVESQGKLESLLQEIDEDKKLLEKTEQESNDLDSEISEQDRAAGKGFDFGFRLDRFMHMHRNILNFLALHS